MKNIRHMLLPSQWFGSSKRRQRPQEKQAKQRRLRSETLEKRELLAGDLMRADVNPHHNGLGGVDANSDGWVTPGDVLVVLNALAAQSSPGGQAMGESARDTIEFQVDVNNDQALTPADALMVINDLNENGPYALGESVEFTLDARDLDGNLIPVDANGNVEVDVDEIFQLEVGSNDLRGLSSTGVFTQFLNLSTDAGQGGILTPVLTEFQELTFGRELADNTVTGDYVFNFGTSGSTFTVSRADLASNVAGQVSDALVSFGYETTDFEVTFVTPTSQTAPFRVQIRYPNFQDPEFLNQDLPDLTVTDNLSVPTTVTSFSASPVNADGSINSAAIPFNIDFANRFFNDNDFYGFNPEGSFDADAGFIATGATVFGASLTAQEKLGGPLPANEPFEAFSLRVFVDQSLTAADPLGVTIEVPTIEQKSESVLLFSQNGRVDESLILLDEDAMVSIVTSVNTANTAPTVGGALAVSLAENAASTPLNLLQGANDADGDTLSVVGLAVQSGDSAGITVAGNTLQIDPSAYAAALNAGDSEVVVYTYQISDGNGGTVNQTATVTITGLNDANNAPTAGAAVTATFTEDNDPATVNLLANAMDADGDTLTVSNVTQVGSDDASGITVDEANGLLNVTPQTYGALNDGDSVAVTYNFTISDGNGGSVQSSATVTITGITDTAGNSAPVLATTPLLASFGEDDNNGSIDLLAGATDADGDTLNVSGLSLVSGNNVGVPVPAAGSPNTLLTTPSSYNFLQAGTTEQIVYTYSIVDGNGGNTAQTLTITVNGANDAPEVGGPLSQTFNESDPASMFNLLAGATDPDTGDTLSVSGASVSGDAAGVTVNGNMLSINPAANAALDAGQSATATVTYQITDGNGGSVNQTATITINGEGTTTSNSAPTVSGPITASFLENANNQSINLLTGAADADGDTLTISNLNVTGDTQGAAVAGNTLNITPSAYSALNDGETAQVAVTYTISDGNGGSVNQSATVTINGISDQVNTAPVVSGAITRTFSEDDPTGTVNLLAGASDADGDTLTVQNIVTTGNAAGVVANGNNLTVTPGAYGSLNTGESTVVTVSYTISDGNGGSVAQTATITINGQDEANVPGSSVSGQLFIDHIDNIDDVVNGATPIRDGIKAANEPALAGITVQLTPSGGAARSTTTDIQGNYSFDNVPPGEYSITYNLPSSVMVTGETTSSGSVPATGNAAVAGPLLGVVGIQGAISNLDILASSYLAANQEMSAVSDGGLEGGSALLDAQGNQELFLAGLGLDGVQFAEITLNENRDAALLTVIEDDGDILTARLRQNQFLVSADGTAVQFFGGVEDFDFAESSEALLTQEFANYRNAIDRVLAQGV